MIKLDEKKLAQLKTGSQHFDEKYGHAAFYVHAYC